MIRREKKKINKRKVNGEEVIFIFEKVLEDWKTIRIFNTFIQLHPDCEVDSKKIKKIATGNCKVFPHELPEERYQYYCLLREKVYLKHIMQC